MDDIALPLVFPAYLIAIPHLRIDLPAFFNHNAAHNNEPETDHVSGLGHAGILFIRGKDGLTKYYEYGRYDPANLGLVRQRHVPDLSMPKNNDLSAPLTPILASISKESGEGGRVKGVMIPVPGKFAAMKDYAEKRMAQNANPARKPYSIMTYNCMTFAEEVVSAAGVDMPYQIDPRPVRYMQKLEELYTNIDYDPRTKKTTLKSIPAKQ